MSEKLEIRPQPGFQERVLSTPADIAIVGGSSGPGKTWCLLFEPLRHYKIKHFNATIIRRTFPQINGPGGLWDQSMELYPHFGAAAVKSNMEWRFPNSRFVFMHMQNEDDWLNVQGSNRVYMAFDELTQFSRNQFFKTFPWIRSGACPVPAYVRASCNPDADSWVASFIDWYIMDDGFPDPERDGKIRYFRTINDEVYWGSSKDEVNEQIAPIVDDIDPLHIKSFTFIKGELSDNQILLTNDPTYRSQLLAMSEEEQMRFLHGNWKVKLDKNIIFKLASFRDIFTNDFVLNFSNKYYITADIATTGRDVFVIAVWKGKAWVDIDLIDRNNGKEAIEAIDRMKQKYGVPNSQILFDADGVGAGMTGWIDNCIEFKAQKPSIGKINYNNRKSQCFFEFSYCVNLQKDKVKEDMYFVDPNVARTIYPFDKPTIYRGKTVRYILEHQMKAIRQEKTGLGGKVAIIKKDEQKSYINGISPDLLEQFAFNESFYLGNRDPIKVKVH